MKRKIVANQGKSIQRQENMLSALMYQWENKISEWLK